MIKSMTKNAGIIEAIKELKEISLPKRIRMEYEMRLKAKRDRYAEDKFVFEQGKEQGFKLGTENGFKLGTENGFKLGTENGFKLGKVQEREDGMRSLIKSLRRNGFSDEQIASELMQEYGLDRKAAFDKIRLC